MNRQHERSSTGERSSPDRLALAMLQDRCDAECLVVPLRAAIAAFDRWAPPASDAGLLLPSLAATRPAAIPDDIGSALAAVVRKGDLRRTSQPVIDEAFRLLALLVATPAYAAIPDLVQDVFLVSGLHPRWYWKAMELLQSLIDWQPDAVDLASLLATAEQIEPREASALFHVVIAPLLLAEPAGCNLDLIQRACALLTDPYEARYLMAALADHDEAPQDVRIWARQLSFDWFPLRATWRQLFGRRPLHVLCVQNIADGQGDEMVRTVPLLQALLDDQPETRVILITDRAYLYGHSRIEAISFDDRPGIEVALGQPFDALIEFFEPRVLHLNHDTDLAYAIVDLRTRVDFHFDFRADKGWNQFTFESVRLGGLEWSDALQFNQLLDNSVYDPALRLLAELGLPLRVGEQPPRSEPVLSGQRWPSADFAWDEVTSGNSQQRPVALLNPFGGNAMLKGFARQKFDDLARLISSLIDEGHFVVICPSGTAWGSRDLIETLLVRLPEDHRRHIGIADDPAHTGLAGIDDGIYRETSRPSDTMRTFINFVARADLIVTVEGWMMHAAYLLGQQFRFLLLPESGDRSWQPWGRSRNQRLWFFAGDPTLDSPPLPEKPRKEAWLALLDRANDPLWHAFLREVAQTDDQDIRRAAIRALGRSGDSDVVPLLASFLKDRSHRTRSVAAEALLNFHRDALGHNSVPDASTLEAYRLISATPFPGWDTLIRQGPSALPALYAALRGDESIMRREAAIVLQRISRAQGPQAVELSFALSRDDGSADER